MCISLYTCSDVTNVQAELAQELKQKKKAEGKNSSKDCRDEVWPRSVISFILLSLLRGVEQELFHMGMQARSDLDIISTQKREANV